MSDLERLLGAVADTRFGSVVCEGEEASRERFNESVRAQAACLLATGIKAADRVLVTSGRGLGYWRDLLASWEVGAVAVPVSTQRNAAEIASLCGAAWSLDGNRLPVPTNGAGPACAQIYARAITERWSAILLTSGSTGRPKGVPVTGAALMGNVQATLHRTALTSSHRLAIATPGHFTSAICHFLASMVSGAGFEATDRRMMPPDLSAFLQQAEATAFGASPVQLRWLVDSPTVPTLRWLMSSGDRLSTDLERKLVARYPRAAIFVAYGLTEVAGRCAIRQVASGNDEGTVGTAIDGLRVHIATTEDAERTTPGAGEIVVSGPLVFNGYVGAVEASPETTMEFATGDIGTIDERGVITVLGRLDDVFKCAGQKVSAALITDAIRSLEGVIDAAVIAEPHLTLGAVPVAFVVFSNSASTHTGTLIAALRERLPTNHIPYALTAIPVIPRTGSGKIDRTVLAEIRARR